MKKGIILSMVLALVFSIMLASTASAQGKVGDVTIMSKTIAIGIGVNWGSGTLMFKGEEYKFKVEGLSVLDVGITSVTAVGEVFEMTDVSQFAGNFTAFEAGATLAGGGSWQTMKNQSGVVMKLSSTNKGVQLTLAPKGVKITMK